MHVFSEPKWQFANFILYLNDDKSSRQKLENWSPQIGLISGGVKIWKCNFKVHFKGPHFAQVITKLSNHRFKLICHWSTALGISHFRPFNTDLYGLYWNSHRQYKVVYSEQLHDPKKVNWNWRLTFIECPIIEYLILSPDSLWRFCHRPIREKCR